MTIEASLSILSSILSIAVAVKDWMSQRGVSAETAIDQLAERGDEQTREALTQAEIREAVLSVMVISKDLLEQLTREALECEKKHVRGRKSAKGHIDKKDADIKAAQCICGVLRDVKLYNNRQLPSSRRLQDFWESYGCEN
jgi:hypothetical protein